jgi:hypothetical protein
MRTMILPVSASVCTSFDAEHFSQRLTGLFRAAGGARKLRLLHRHAVAGAPYFARYIVQRDRRLVVDDVRAAGGVIYGGALNAGNGADSLPAAPRRPRSRYLIFLW